MTEENNSLELENLEQTLTQIKLNSLSDEDLLNEIDKYFPYKDSAGFPTYRQYQRESIFNTLKAFQKGVRCVIIDGPVGSGKSIINYTIGRVCGSAVYLTPQKQLQDQISKENWSRTKMVKGKNAYYCHYCLEKYTDIADIYVSCDYTGEEYKMCNNAEELSTYDKSDFDEELIRTSVLRTLETYKNDEVKRRKFTSFEPNEDIDKIFSEIKTYCDIKDSETGKVTKYPIANLVGCKLAPIECSMKSARIVSKIYDMRILNPDIFYMLTRKANDYYGNIDLLIIDECHSIENVISRIFSTKIPIDVLKHMFGLNLESLLYCKNPEDFAVMFQGLMKSRIGPMLSAAKIFNDMGDTIKAHLSKDKDGKYHTNLKNIKSQTEYASYLRIIENIIIQLKLDFSIIHLANIAFTNSFETFVKSNKTYECFRGFVNYIREKFIEKCASYGCDNHIDFYGSFILNAKSHFRQFSGLPNRLMEEIALINYTVEFMESMDIMIDKISQIVNFKNGNYRVFVFHIGEGDSAYTCRGSDIEQLTKTYEYYKENCKYIEVVPANIGSLMNYAFYRFANHILLSTGTWIDWRNMIRTFGLNPDKDVKYLKIPSTFNLKRRPIYILDNPSYTNFSQKINDPKYKGEWLYVYQTSEGEKKWLLEVKAVLDRIRNFIGNRRNIDPESFNMVVHTHSFAIAKKLAENGYIDDKWIIHTGNKNSIFNKKTGKLVKTGTKDELVQELMNHPDSGLTFVSPSITEGMDFKNGIARAQLILKMPIPYVMDPYVQLKSHGNKDIGIYSDREYFIRTALITLAQMYGRIMRGPDDFGYTFCFDQKICEEFKRLLSPEQKNRLIKMNIRYFLDGIKMHRDEYNRPIFEWFD